MSRPLAIAAVGVILLTSGALYLLHDLWWSTGLPLGWRMLCWLAQSATVAVIAGAGAGRLVQPWLRDLDR